MNNILKIAQDGEGILNLVAVPVIETELNTPWLFQFIEAMQHTMLARQGVGIAAPQVYVSKRIIIVASRPNARYPEAPEMPPVVMINPEILQRSELQLLGEEGCLSVANVRGQVGRAADITVRYFTPEGLAQVQQFNGFVARIVQHEIDHLDGILFTSRLSTEDKP